MPTAPDTATVSPAKDGTNRNTHGGDPATNGIANLATSQIQDETFQIITEWVFIKHTDTRQAEIKNLFDQAGITEWQLIHGMDFSFLETFVNGLPAASRELDKMIYRGRLLQVLRYGTIPDSFPTFGMSYSDVTAAIKAHYPDQPAASSNSSTSTPPSGPDHELKTRIPEFPKFLGVATNFY